MVYFFVAVWVFFGISAASIAAYRGYPYPLFALLGTPFGPLSFVVAILLPPIGEGRGRAEDDARVDREVRDASATFTCRECGRQNSVAARVCPRCGTHFS
jgi:hypothetical protein